jgi:hypothetical protein
MNVWDLHGPSEFISGIEEELRASRAVVVAFPLHRPPGFADKLAARLDRKGWHRLNLAWREGDHPVAFLFRELRIELELTERQSVLRFVERLPPMVVVVEEIPASDWPRWKRFLAEYEAELRRRGEGLAPLLLCVLSGVDLDEARLNAPAISLHPWVGVISELDTLTYIRAQSSPSQRTGIEGEISRRIIARLSLWDVEFARSLARLSVKELTSPTEILNELAQKRAWKVGGAGSWCAGASNVFEGVKMSHSAWLTINDEHDELATRIWSAQAAVALPLVEQRRRELAARAERHLRFPVEIDGEQVSSARELQIGPLCHLLSVARCNDRELMRRVRLLKRVRNALAHVKVVDASLLFDPDLIG